MLLEDVLNLPMDVYRDKLNIFMAASTELCSTMNGEYQIRLAEQEVGVMTTIRQTAFRELEKIPEDKLFFILQIMQGVNGLYTDSQQERKEAFTQLEQLRKKGTVIDDKVELASYREEKYGR